MGVYLFLVVIGIHFFYLMEMSRTNSTFDQRMAAWKQAIIDFGFLAALIIIVSWMV